MPRAKGGFKTARRKKRLMKMAEGYRGARSKLTRTATETVDNALATAYIGRKLKKREYRKLWQTRIGALSKSHGVSYSALMGRLKKRQVALDRKMLAMMAVDHPEDFKALLEFAGNV